MGARDSFGIGSAAYAADRPHYPPALFGWIASACVERGAAWDCATGNGQAALGLAPYFRRVEATDISAQQLAHAFRAPNVDYSVRPAERTGFADSRFDLIAVAQALHWFDFGSFWDEVRRVAKPDAFLCAWGYSWFAPEPELDDLYRLYLNPLAELLETHWAPNNRILWNGYANEEIAFPFERIRPPPFAIPLRWGFDRLIGYVHTWSAYKAATEDASKAEAIERIETDARAALLPRGTMNLTLPLAIAAGRIP